MRFPSWLLTVVALIGAVVIVGASVLTYTNVRHLIADSPVALPNVPSLSDLGQPTLSAALPTGLPSATALALTVSTPVATVQPGAPVTNVTNAAPLVAPTASPAATDIPSIATRVTILLIGTDQRPGEKDAPRTDTLIVVSIDPARKTAAMISIPRDTYMTIPGIGVDRVNTAYGTGLAMDYPGGAPLLTVKTIQNLTGIPIQHYFLLNFDVFYAAMDAMGPIEVCPNTAIHDPAYPDANYGYIVVDFKPGCQMLNSIQLLQYARVRHNAGDDFGRAARQQEVIRAVRAKALSLGGVSGLIGQAGTLWGKVHTNVSTDMTFEQMLSVAQTGLAIPQANISSVVLTDKGGYYIPSTTSDGQQVLSPIYEKVHAVVQNVLDAPPGQPYVDKSAHS